MFNIFKKDQFVNLSDAIKIKIDYSPIKIEFANMGSVKSQSQHQSENKPAFHLNKFKS